MYKVMLADDEGIVIDSLKFILEKEFAGKCQIESAKTGRSVIELAEHFRPDIAIMDIQMPGINGIEAMREIKKTNEKTVFIVMSAYDKFDYAKEAINLGVLEYLNKPVDKKKIVSVVQKAMDIIDKERDKRTQELIVKEKMETVVPIIENGLIYDILFQKNFEEDINNYKNLLGIKENYGYMAVLVCGDDQDGNHMTNAVGAGVKMQNKYYSIREIVKGYIPCIMGAVMANKITIFVPRESAGMDYNERIEIMETTRQLVRKLKQQTEIQFRIGIGSVRSLNESIQSYSEALNSLIDTTGSVAHVDDLPIGCDYEDNYPVETERKLFDNVQKGDVNGAISAANQFFEWMVENYSEYVMDIKLKVLEFVLWAERIAYESGGMVYRFRVRKDYLPTLLDFENYEEIGNWFIDKIAQSSRNVVVKKDEQSTSVVSKAKTYIDTHYNKDISLYDVSREVDISPYYFSKIFKEETGENFIEYLTNVRIEQAKTLLTGSGLSMKEICAQIGYGDPNYFSRAFKKKTGLTPTEFKGDN